MTAKSMLTIVSSVVAAKYGPISCVMLAPECRETPKSPVIICFK